MRFKLFMPAVFLLLIVFLARSAPAQQEHCRIINSSGLCIDTGLQIASCVTTGTCGPNCPLFTPGTSFPLIAIALGTNFCPEPAIVNARTVAVAGSYEVNAHVSIEGLTSQENFYRFNESQLCLGGVIRDVRRYPCSQCRTYRDSGRCYQFSSTSLVTCVTSADCIPGACQFPHVAAGLTASHGCLISGVGCSVLSDADVLGTFASGSCTWRDRILVEGWSYMNCNGERNSRIGVGVCPRQFTNEPPELPKPTPTK